MLDDHKAKLLIVDDLPENLQALNAVIRGAGRAFSSRDEVIMAAQLGQVHVQAPVKVELDVYDSTEDGGTVQSHAELVETTRRFTSSGNGWKMLPLRNPASTWQTGILR